LTKSLIDLYHQRLANLKKKRHQEETDITSDPGQSLISFLQVIKGTSWIDQPTKPSAKQGF